MPNVNNISFGGLSNADLQAQQLDLQRRQQMADMLRQQATTPIQQQQVSGRVVPISPWEGLAKIATAYLANRNQAGLDQRQAELGDAGRKRVVEALRAMAPPEAGLNNAAPQVSEGAAPATLDSSTPLQTPQVDPATRARWVQLLSTAEANPKLADKLLEQELTAPKWSTSPHYDQQGRAFILSDKGGKPQYLDGISARDKLENVNGVWQNPYSQGENTFAPQDPNKPFGVGPQGVVPNLAYQQYIERTARAGAPSVSVNTATRPFLSEIGRGAGEAVTAAYNGAQSAVGTIQNVNQIRQGLGNAILGPGANVRVTLAQIGQTLGITGKNTEEQLQNTRAVVQGLARQELSAAAAMKGQGQITESERAILRRAESGQISEMTGPEIKTLLGALERTANYRFGLHEQNMQRLRKDPNAQGIVDYMQVQRPATGDGWSITPVPGGR
jgi:hypothetical protein